jgi:hypothetical protein
LCITALQKTMNAVSVFRCIDPRLIAPNPASADKIVAFPDVGARLWTDGHHPIGRPGYHRQTEI